MARKAVGVALGGLALAVGIGVVLAAPRPSPSAVPATVRLAAGVQDYRPAGEFRIGTRIVDAPPGGRGWRR